MEASFLKQIVLPVSLFIIMFGMGLSLVIADFTRLFKYPRLMFTGLLGQILLLPLCGFAVAHLYQNEPYMALGVMLIAACPGGTVSNLITHLARGELALSISLTAISCVLSTITIPIVLGLSLSHFSGQEQHFDIQPERIIAVLFALTIIPVTLGMLARHYWTRFANRVEKSVRVFGAFFLMFLIVSIVVEEADTVLNSITKIGGGALALNLSTMLLGFLIARAAGANSKQTTTIALELGVQNSALAILLAISVFQQPEMSIPPAIYGLGMLLTGSFVILYRKHTLSPAKATTAKI